jgi:DNA topoisomerase-1
MALAPVSVDAGAADAAAGTGLRYVSDAGPGIVRIRSGRGFRCRLQADGRPVRDGGTLARIRALAIPPAWTSVWICPSATGHIQAVGRDARGRKQYRYHARWRAIRDEAKYARLRDFGRVLPRIRRQVRRDLAARGLPRRKILATVVRLLESTLIRVGNEEYARQNHSYGLTTLRTRHVRVRGPRLRFEFRGKGGKLHVVALTDRRLARVIQRCQELPGHDLFQSVDDEGRRQSIGSADVNDYLRQIAGREFTAKDFRTWGGTVLAAGTLRAVARAGAARDRKAVSAMVAVVAEQLRNTPAICRKCYIHPAVLTAFQEGALGPVVKLVRPGRRADLRPDLHPEERAVLWLLERTRKPAAG